MAPPRSGFHKTGYSQHSARLRNRGPAEITPLEPHVVRQRRAAGAKDWSSSGESRNLGGEFSGCPPSSPPRQSIGLSLTRVRQRRRINSPLWVRLAPGLGGGKFGDPGGFTCETASLEFGILYFRFLRGYPQFPYDLLAILASGGPPSAFGLALLGAISGPSMVVTFLIISPTGPFCDGGRTSFARHMIFPAGSSLFLSPNPH